MPSQLIDSYLQKCSSYSVKPSKRAIQSLSSQSNDKSQLVAVNGNNANTFEERITDVTLFPLVETLGQVSGRYLYSYLDLSYNQITEQSSEAFRQLSDFQYINLRGNNIKKIKPFIRIWKSQDRLSALDISENPIEDIEQIASLLEENPNIQAINISRVDSLTTKPLVRICLALAKSNIKIFRMARPPMAQLPREVVLHLSDILKTHSRLHVLDLSLCALTCHDLQIFFRDGVFLHRHNVHPLRILNLTANHIGVDGVSILAEFLSRPTCQLTHLYLGSNRIGSQGAQVLSQIFMVNQSLIYLDVSSNRIGSLGLSELISSIANNRPNTLHVLRMRHNLFDQTSIAKLYHHREKLANELDVEPYHASRNDNQGEEWFVALREVDTSQVSNEWSQLAQSGLSLDIDDSRGAVTNHLLSRCHTILDNYLICRLLELFEVEEMDHDASNHDEQVPTYEEKDEYEDYREYEQQKHYEQEEYGRREYEQPDGEYEQHNREHEHDGEYEQQHQYDGEYEQHDRDYEDYDQQVPEYEVHNVVQRRPEEYGEYEGEYETGYERHGEYAEGNEDYEGENMLDRGEYGFEHHEEYLDEDEY